MKNIRFYCFLFIILATNSNIANAISNQTSYWQCETQDKEQNAWTAKNFYRKVAINLAFTECKKNSKFPSSCATSKSSCEQFVNGVSRSPLWRCTTFDTAAQPWQSNYYRIKDDAALASKAFCKENSTIPETCYTNYVTCENLNEGVKPNGLFSGINW